MTTIYKLSDVQSTTIGEDTNIWQYCVVLPNAVIGSSCNISSHCFIEGDVLIGNNVTIKNGVQIWDATLIEDDVFVGPNITFTDDKMPCSKNYLNKFQGPKIKKGASIGASSKILPGIVIGEFAMVEAGSVVTENVAPYSIVLGNPSKLFKNIRDNI